MHPPDQLYVYGAAPPVVEDITLPSQLPKQEAGVLERLGITAEGGFTVTLEVAAHPLASVTVIE